MGRQGPRNALTGSVNGHRKWQGFGHRKQPRRSLALWQDGSTISVSGGQCGVGRQTRHRKNPGGARRWRVLSTTTTLFSQRAEPRAVVVENSPGTPYWTRDNTDFPPLMRQGEERLRLACPLPVRRAARAAGEGCRWRERPPLFFCWCITGEG